MQRDYKYICVQPFEKTTPTNFTWLFPKYSAKKASRKLLAEFVVKTPWGAALGRKGSTGEVRYK